MVSLTPNELFAVVEKIYLRIIDLFLSELSSLSDDSSDSKWLTMRKKSTYYMSSAFQNAYTFWVQSFSYIHDWILSGIDPKNMGSYLRQYTVSTGFHHFHTCETSEGTRGPHVRDPQLSDLPIFTGAGGRLNPESPTLLVVYSTRLVPIF